MRIEGGRKKKTKLALTPHQYIYINIQRFERLSALIRVFLPGSCMSHQ
jgi:hypothetical protein